MPKTVMLGKLDLLVGVTFDAAAFATMSATQINGSITTDSTSTNEVLTYAGLTGTIGSAFIAMNTVTFQVASVSDANNTLVLDVFVGKSLVGTLNFTVCGFSGAGIALAAMPLDSLVTQSGNLPGLNGSLFMLGVGAAGAGAQSIGFDIGGTYAFLPAAKARYATADNPVLQGGKGQQMLIALSGNTHILGGPGKTVIRGGPGNDVLTAGSGKDWVYGGAGTDAIYGGSGNDTLVGGSGTDTIYAGTGHMVMVGGSGADTFVFGPGGTGGLLATTADVIQRFRPGLGDMIDLSAFDSQLPLAAGGHLNFIGTAAFSGHAGELRYDVTGTSVALTGDLTGAGTASFMIVLTGTASLAATQLVL